MQNELESKQKLILLLEIHIRAVSKEEIMGLIYLTQRSHPRLTYQKSEKYCNESMQVICSSCMILPQNLYHFTPLPWKPRKIASKLPALFY